MILTLPGRGTFVAELDTEAQRAAATGVLARLIDDMVRQARLLGLTLEDLRALLNSRWHHLSREDDNHE
ncbi:MAG: hypothetical protein Q8P31_01570 [Bacillota bacterium]|nr:hypothetical protein [Bacillota bacterium]